MSVGIYRNMSGKVAIAPPAHKRPMHFSKCVEPQYPKPPAHKRVPHVWKAPELIPVTVVTQEFTDMSFIESLIRAGLMGPAPADADDV